MTGWAKRILQEVVTRLGIPSNSGATWSTQGNMTGSAKKDTITAAKNSANKSKTELQRKKDELNNRALKDAENWLPGVQPSLLLGTRGLAQRSTLQWTDRSVEPTCNRPTTNNNRPRINEAPLDANKQIKGHTRTTLTARVEEGVRYHTHKVLHEVEQVPRWSRPRRDHDLRCLRDGGGQKRTTDKSGWDESNGLARETDNATGPNHADKPSRAYLERGLGTRAS